MILRKREKAGQELNSVEIKNSRSKTTEFDRLFLEILAG